jgi:hypothetical protein
MAEPVKNLPTLDESAQFESGRPVASVEMEYKWHGGQWKLLFDEQIKLIKSDVVRAKTADKLVVYLSCPISGRGGGHSGTNVDIALATQRRLLDRWGEGAWILNPANYQMESRLGTGLMNQHADRLGINLAELIKFTGMPGGGDYMRMWTKVLVENGDQVGRAQIPSELANTGQFFDAYYFIGPRDMHRFLRRGDESLTAAIENYFARRSESDPEFRAAYSGAPIEWIGREEELDGAGRLARDKWRLSRNAFLRFYMFRAGAAFSLGSHDEWNIWCALNALRRKPSYGISEQIAGFFEGRQIAPGAAEVGISKGYAT